MERTPQEHVEAVKDFCKQVENLNLPGLIRCYVDDWGRFSNFSVFIHFKLGNKKLRSEINRKVRQLIKGKPFKIRAKEDRNQPGEIALDIDYKPYNPATNTFEGQPVIGSDNQLNLFS